MQRWFLHRLVVEMPDSLSLLFISWLQRADENSFAISKEGKKRAKNVDIMSWKRICLRYNFMLGNDVKLRELLGRRWVGVGLMRSHRGLCCHGNLIRASRGENSSRHSRTHPSDSTTALHGNSHLSSSPRSVHKILYTSQLRAALLT